MRRLVIVVVLIGFASFGLWRLMTAPKMSGAPPYGEDRSSVPNNLNPLSWLRDWKRPEGLARVGIQIGHWQHEQAPEEQKRLRNNGGARGGGVDEVEINTLIATQLKELLEQNGVVVDVLPVTIPPGYYADAFVSIHADGSLDSKKSGFKIAQPWRDFTGKAGDLVRLLSDEYAEATGLEIDPNITRNMRGYYAFSWWRYEHAIHPMTPAVIVETGFVTNTSDRSLLKDSPEIPAQALSDGIVRFLEQEQLL